MKDKQNNKDQKIFAKFEQELKEKKKLPENEQGKIKRRIFFSVLSFLLILIYLIIIKILEDNISTNSYFIVLKIFSVILCFITIIMMEISYKKNKNSLILIAVELLIITFFTIFLISAYSIYYGQFYKVIIVAIIVSAMYNLIKTIAYMRMIRINYNKSLNDIKTIVAKR